MQSSPRENNHVLSRLPRILLLFLHRDSLINASIRIDYVRLAHYEIIYRQSLENHSDNQRLRHTTDDQR